MNNVWRLLKTKKGKLNGKLFGTKDMTIGNGF